MRFLASCLALWAFIDVSNGVSTKMDFGEDDATVVVTNSSNVEDEDVEVKHTIVVSTKLKNNNRRALHSNSDGDTGTLTYRVGQSHANDDSGEVPIVNGYKALETTAIRTPDSRNTAKIYPDAIFVNRNIRDEYDVYPNVATNPIQWKPSNFYNNINWWHQENDRQSYNADRKINRPQQIPGKLNRKISDGGMREFYCRKCVELSQGQGMRGCTLNTAQWKPAVVQQRSAHPWLYETTTQKIKIDGKLAKLN